MLYPIGTLGGIAGAVYTCRSIHVAAENENKMAAGTDNPIALRASRCARYFLFYFLFSQIVPNFEM